MNNTNRRGIGIVDKKGISVFVLVIGIVLFLVLPSAIPVTAIGEITATRDISSQNVTPGDTFTVTVAITANQEIEALALDEDLPNGWAVTQVSDDAAAFKESTTEWIWTEKLSAGNAKTVIYDVTVPSDANGTYYITGNVSAYQVSSIDVGGESEVYVKTIDATPPTIASVELDKYVASPNEPIEITVKASDNVGVVNVTAKSFNATWNSDAASLTLTSGAAESGIWTGTITAPSTTGTYNISVVAKDAAGNVAINDSIIYKIKEEQPSQLKELWHSEVSGNVKDVFSSDLDNDGEKEVIAGTDENKIYVFDAKGNKKWEYTAGSAVRQVCAADFNGDGKKEVVAGTDYKDLGNIYTFDSSGNLLWKFQTGAKHYRPDNKLNVRTITAGDADNDGKEEIIVGSTHHHWFPGRVCILGEGGNLEGEYWNPGYAYSIQITDMENDGDNEIIVGFVNNDYGYEGAIALFNGNDVSGEAPAAANGYDYSAGSQMWYWHSGVDHSNIFSISSFDLDGNGINEIIAGSDDHNVYVLDSTGNVKWKYGTAGRIGEESIYVSDLDNDGKGEVIAGSYDNNAYCIDYEGNLKWKYETVNPVIPFADDIDNDGISEVVAVSDKVHVLTNDGEVKYDYPKDGVAYVADLGMDNIKEFILGSSTTVYALAITGENQSPIANFTYSPPNPVVNQPVTFDASSSYDPDGTIVSYEWEFGDGNIENTTEAIIDHSYASSGDYMVNLTVRDDEDATNSTTKEIIVTNVTIFISIANTNVSQDGNITLPITVYNVTSTDLSGLSSATVSLSYDPNVTVISKVEDLYPPDWWSYHTINNSAGKVTIAGFSWRPGEGLMGNEIILANLTFVGVGANGSHSDLNFTEIELRNGTGIELPVAIQNGSITISNVVEPNYPPETPNAPSGPSRIYNSTHYNYSISTIDPNWDDVKYTFDWDDGTQTVTDFVKSGETVSAAHNWSNTGTYNIKVMATDEEGANSSWSNPLTVTALSYCPGIKISIANTNVSQGGNITLPITVYNVTSTDLSGLSSATVSLSYDPNVTVISKVEDLYPPDWWSYHTINNSAGKVTIVGFSWRPGEGLMGNEIILANLTFVGVGANGSHSDLNFTEIELRNGTGIELPVAIQNGSITIGPGITPSIISFKPPEIKIPKNITKTTNLTLDTVPNGLSGYNITISLSNISVAELTSVSFPDWATLHSNSSLPANSLWIKAADLDDQIKSGAMNITLATLTIRGDKPGTSNICTTVKKMDDDNGNSINPNTIPGTIVVTSVISLPDHINPPTDPDGDGLYEDLNGNGVIDFDDIVQFFKYMEWIENNEPIHCFDFNKNGHIDFDDIVKLFEEV